MNDYNKDYFWTSVDPITQEKKYFFKINNSMVEVSKDVYNVCFNSYVKELRDNKRTKNKERMSLDHVYQNGIIFYDILDNGDRMEDDVFKQILIEKMMLEISKLSNDEKMIILKILLEDKSVRQLSMEMNIPYMTMKRKRDKILKKLKKKIEKW